MKFFSTPDDQKQFVSTISFFFNRKREQPFCLQFRVNTLKKKKNKKQRENYFSFFFYDATSFFLFNFDLLLSSKSKKQIYLSTFLFRKKKSRMRQVREESGWFKLTLKSQENQDADNRKMNSYLHRIFNYFNRSYRQTSHTNTTSQNRILKSWRHTISLKTF